MHLVQFGFQKKTVIHDIFVEEIIERDISYVVSVVDHFLHKHFAQNAKRTKILYKQGSKIILPNENAVVFLNSIQKILF